MQRIFTIYFEDLNEKAQHYLLEEFKTTVEEENWDVMPLTTIEREMKD